MNRRKWLWYAVPVLAACAAGIAGYTFLGAQGPDDPLNVVAKGKAAEPLPIRQVVLFNAGVGYFQREGEVDGNARVELSFPVGDINDLLKSLVLQDAKGRIGTVNYDSSDPIEKILRSFALDLTANPTFGQILNQARGEKIEISRSEKKDGQTTKITGTIVGMEIQHRPVGKDHVLDVEVLNLNTATGLMAIPMEQIVSVRFQNPTLENEFQRALQVLARSHDSQKKTVSVGFNGEGKRPVKVGYVVERPIWKTTYRLSIDPKEKVSLQAWALVENTSDDDWNDVRMVLVSGKPISFRMNLYDPIYIPRPFVEPELFASLRPQVYGGAIEEGDRKVAQAMKDVEDIATIEKMLKKEGKKKEAGYEWYDSGNKSMKQMTESWGRLSARERQHSLQNLVDGMSPREREAVENYFRNLGEGRDKGKLEYREYAKKQDDSIKKMEDAKKVGQAITGFNFKEGIQSVATADEVGDYFQYTIDQKITLPRQKSAMLPILNQTIEGSKFSIFNESVHNKYPLLGLKLKNSTGQPLTQGPITVYDGVFGGDTRILDLQPGEERLLSYALDQGTEVKTETKEAPSPDMTFKIGHDNLAATYDIRQTKTYTIKNRSTHDREVLIEHPLRSGWKLVEPKKALEQTRDLYRFQVSVKAGKTATYDVVEDNPRVDNLGAAPTYAIAAGVNVRVEARGDFHKLTGVKIEKGLVIPTYKMRETRTYFVQNLSDVDRNFTVDHIVRPDWVRLDDKNDPHAGPAVFRFKLAVAKGKTGDKSVREERTQTDKGVLLKSLNETQVKDFLNSPVVSADVKAAFTKALVMQAKITDTQKQIADVEKQLTILTADHTRVRENLKIIPMTSDHYKTFLEKFVAQDKQIESYQKNVRDLNATSQTQIRDYDQFLAKLDAE
ncbi:MAG: DUF4139 domain-containing protein [Planctomycetes bacterium]|nr:DUF4139 domain-containing protein [Planctomycetota bacterium]